MQSTLRRHIEQIKHWDKGKCSVSGRGEKGVSKTMYCLSFQGKQVSLRTAVDCEARKHLENVIKNILGLFSSANASFISANVEKFIQYHYCRINKKKKKKGKNKTINIYNKARCNT